MKRVMVTMLAVMAAVSNLALAADMIQIKGSDTLINLVQKLAEEYMQENYGAAIAVTGGGSGTGIAALVNKKCDVANASRQMKSSEVEQAANAGVNAKRVVVAFDGLSVIVNGGNSVRQLTMEQIGKIFSGDIRNWSEVGGANSPITIYGRQSNSGTFGFFRDIVVKKDYAGSMNQMNGNAQIVEAVKSDPSGIGYVGVGYVRDVYGITVLRVASRDGGVYASPLNAEDVKTGVYPISRPLNQYINGKPSGALRDFIAFELSPEGQRIVEEEGFFPVPTDYQEYNKSSVGI
jgi:phosphate transport system substrate-binding protein